MLRTKSRTRMAQPFCSYLVIASLVPIHSSFRPPTSLAYVGANALVRPRHGQEPKSNKVRSLRAKVQKRAKHWFTDDRIGFRNSRKLRLSV